MIWYGVEVRSVPGIFWKTICDIDEALDNINFGFVIETVKPDAKHLQGQDIGCYRNRKGV